jgi:membrane-bound lytic murein transglycosylase D
MVMGRSPIALFFIFWAAPLLADSLPRPAGLEPDIAFWRRVFTDVTSQQALIHDNRNLGIVYEKIDLPKDSSPKQRRRISDRARKRYRQILGDLADGNRQALTFEERRVLSLWPDDVSAEELAKAANQVRFQQGLADRFRDGYIRAGLWQEYIRTRLREAGVPESLASLPHVESSFNPEARSYVGASGLWQFTRSTGKRFMQIDHVVDERRDPFMSSAAAARLLQYNYSILNSWPLAITAYNHGVAGMRRAVKGTGTDDIEAIVREYDGRAFGFASRNFYVAFLAAHDVDQNAERYFGPLERARPQAEIVVTMTDYVVVDTLANVFGVSLSTLKDHNPALLKSVWSGTKFVPRGFTVRLPATEPGLTPETLLAAIPADQRFGLQTPDLQHRVERGDSLSVIAARYRTSVSELMALNDLRSRHQIRIGQTLNLPYRGPVSLASIPEGTDTYVVQRGDTVGVIARRAGMRDDEILALNDLPNRNRIYPGQRLLLVAEVSEPVTTGADAGVRGAAEPQAPPARGILSEVSLPASAGAALQPVAVDSVEMVPLVIPDGVVSMDQPMVVADEPAEEDDIDRVGEPAEQDNPSPSLADPSDYEVTAEGSIEVQAAETLGHYADWLEIRTQRLRNLNGYSFRQPVVIGQWLKLDFSVVDRREFAARRIRYHRELQETFFTRYRITDTTTHSLRRGESLYLLTVRHYKVPIWLLRQYNPDLDLNRVNYGTKVVFPRIERVDGPDAPASEIADAA